MKLGTENRKSVIALCVLGAGALYGVYSNFAPDSSSTPAPKAVSTAQPGVDSVPADSDQAVAPRARVRNEEWHPVVIPKSKEERIDPNKIDPTLRLDLLAKVQESKPAGGDRNLFEFGAEKPKVVELPKGPEPKIAAALPRMGPPPLPEPAPPPPPPPPPPMPPINAKYYGFATPARSGHRRGFFMDGEDILIKGEGEMLVGHYKIVKLEAASVTVQDTDSKRTKTIQMEQDASN